MSTTKKKANDVKARYRVVSRLIWLGDRMEPGDVLDLTEHEAARFSKDQVVKVGAKKQADVKPEKKDGEADVADVSDDEGKDIDV
jgi:hypothetical protein